MESHAEAPASVSTVSNEEVSGAPPPVLVRLPPVLAGLFPDVQRRVAICVQTVDEMVDALDRRWPGMRDCLCDSSPAIRRHINIFVDGKRATLATRLSPGTDVFILTAISGG